LSNEFVGLIGLVLILVLMFLKIPLGISFILVGGAGIALLGNFAGAMERFANLPFNWTTNYAYSCLPMFIFMGLLVGSTGLAKDIYQAAFSWLGRVPGGLATTTLVACAAFGAIQGSALAAASTMSLSAFPEMKRYGYDRPLAAAVIAVGATLAIMIPPSTTMIVYGIVSETSISEMFIAGFIPGILEMLMLCIIVTLMVKLKPSLAPVAGVSVSLNEKIKVSVKIIPVLLVFLCVFVGIYGGIFTPTEAGAAGAAATLVISLFMRRLSWKGLKDAITQTVILTGALFLILVGVTFFNTFMAVSNIAGILREFMAGLGVSATGFLAIFILVYLVLGTAMDDLSVMLLTLPIILPTANAMGINQVWLGILIIIAYQIGFISPPYGLVVFFTNNAIPEVPVWDIFKAAMPLLPGLIIVLLLILFIPDIALWPTYFMK
jgi:C4-dicarboxylate transporter, DctM subunit